jgi:hypothetical protein
MVAVPSTGGYVAPLDELPYRKKKRRKWDCGRWASVGLDGLSDPGTAGQDPSRSSRSRWPGMTVVVGDGGG